MSEGTFWEVPDAVNLNREARWRKHHRTGLGAARCEAVGGAQRGDAV